MNTISLENIILNFKEWLNLFFEIFENLILQWKLYEIEKSLMAFLKEYILWPIYELIFSSFWKVENKLKEVAEKKWYNQTKKQEVIVPIPTGKKLKVKSLYAYQNNDNKKKWKHLTLDYFWIINKKTPLTIKEFSSTWIYSMSFKVAENILKERWIETNSNQIMKSTYSLSELAIEKRWEISFENWESFEWEEIILWSDWWRIRTRKNKRWRKTKKWMHTYEWDWREPKNFVIWKLWNDWKVEWKPIYDWVIWTGDEMWEILEKYLKYWKIDKVKKIYVVCDGAHRQWNKIKEILDNLWVDRNKIQRILDYYHWSEHIYDFVNSLWLWKKEKKKNTRKLKKLLWNWKINELLEEMESYCKWKNKEELEKKIWYFVRNKERIIDYWANKKNKLPCWSWIIESMIRRVVNLRMKWNSIFWKCPNANLMLYMRSQILSWRYNVVFENTLETLKTSCG